MSLQFIIGSSGAGKSYFAYERVIRESMEHPGEKLLYYCSGAVYYADTEDAGGNASGKRNPEY